MSDFTASLCTSALSGSYFVLSSVQLSAYLLGAAFVGAVIASNVVNFYWRNK